MKESFKLEPITFLRITVAIIMMSHGGHRLFTGGYNGFGHWLDSQGIPLGIVVAWLITLIEFFGAPFFAMGKYVFKLSIAYLLILLGGLFMVHISNGWFVVGSGSNGAEYSVLLCVSIICIAYPYYVDRNIKKRI